MYFTWDEIKNLEIIREDYKLNHIFQHIVNMGKKYILENDIKYIILGVSGGIDSAVVAVLAREISEQLAIAAYKCPTIGYVLPIESKNDEITRGIDIARTICNKYYVEDMRDLYHNIAKMFSIDYMSIDFDTKVRQGNIKARLRMMKLFDAARASNGIVLSTDNLTELLLGFWTLHGDVGNLGFIQNLWKTEIYLLANYIIDEIKLSWLTEESRKALQECVKATPTDGLGVTDSDFDQLGVNSYQEIDKILLGYIRTEHIIKELKRAVDRDIINTASFPLTHEILESANYYSVDSPIIKRYLSTEFKRNDPYNLSRCDLIHS
jgi:NAD+ synthetase